MKISFGAWHRNSHLYVNVAIAMALHLYFDELHDEESFVGFSCFVFSRRGTSGRTEKSRVQMKSSPGNTVILRSA